MSPKRSASVKSPDEEKDKKDTEGASAKGKGGFVPRKIVREQVDATGGEARPKTVQTSCGSQSATVPVTAAVSPSSSGSTAGQSTSNAPGGVASLNGSNTESPAEAVELPTKHKRVASVKARALLKEQVVGLGLDSDKDNSDEDNSDEDDSDEDDYDEDDSDEDDSDGAGGTASGQRTLPSKRPLRHSSSRVDDRAAATDHDYKAAATTQTSRRKTKKPVSAEATSSPKPSGVALPSAATELRLPKAKPAAASDRQQPAKGISSKPAVTTASVTAKPQQLPLPVAAVEADTTDSVQHAMHQGTDMPEAVKGGADAAHGQPKAAGACADGIKCKICHANVTCPMCRKVMWRCDLKKHLKIVHAGEKPHKCPHCEFASRLKGNLKTHIAGVHLKTRNHECPRCQRMYKTRGAMITHIRLVHEGMYLPKEKRFECQECPKKFFTKYQLQQHGLLHTGEKPFACAFCDKRCTRKADLKTHIKKVHLKIKPFRCSYCDEAFGQKQRMLLHVRKFHVSGVVGELQPAALASDEDICEDMDEGDVVDEKLSDGC